MNSKNVFPGRVVFDHLAKTAGQAINDWLVKALGAGCVTPNLIGDHQDLIRKYGGLYSVISAHVHFADGESPDPRYQYMTVLREPVDRIVSWLFFLVNNHDESELPDLIPAAKRFLESDGVELSGKLSGSISNVYVEHFCRIGGAAPTCGDEKVLRSLAAIQNYDVVGIYEDMPLFLRDVARLIGLTAPTGIARVNVTQKRPSVDQITPTLRERIVELNQLDLRLYAEVLAWKASAVQEHSMEALGAAISAWQRYDPVRDRVLTTPDVTIQACTLREGSDIRHGQLMTFDVDFSVSREVHELEMGIHIFDSDRQWAFGINSSLLGQTHELLQCGSYRVSHHVVADLPAGAYTAGFAFAELLPEGLQELAWHDSMCKFQVYHQVSQTFAGYSYLPAEISLRPIASWMHKEINSSSDAHCFRCSDPRLLTQVGMRTEHDIVCTGQAGCLIYGPYISLAAGLYQIAIRGTIGDGGIAGARMDVAFDKGDQLIAECPLLEPDQEGRLITLSISLNAPCTDLEVRVWVTGNSDLRISMIELEILKI
ncbi:Wzt carbohydrate-binding domain-containing protein [Paraburkholderia sp. MM6662-R1]|uniref:Wzt carbohydrate-binding domain-containing protein n=1 Tax=Paraburkholderia sp. MM6662-R1 TaxID=2991066 RepID=UPI003D23ED3F